MLDFLLAMTFCLSQFIPVMDFPSIGLVSLESQSRSWTSKSWSWSWISKSWSWSWNCWVLVLVLDKQVLVLVLDKQVLNPILLHLYLIKCMYVYSVGVLMLQKTSSSEIKPRNATRSNKIYHIISHAQNSRHVNLQLFCHSAMLNSSYYQTDFTYAC